MVDLVIRYAELVQGVALGTGPWMVFNATLATIPAALAIALFHRRRPTTVVWLLGVALFVLFLPNAPYVVTDLIHLRNVLEDNPGTPVSDMVPAGALVALVLWGVGCYAIALAEIDRFLARSPQLARRRLRIRAGVHVLCAIGVVLGRIPRLHSWHVVTRPAQTVDGIVGVLHPLAVPLVLGLAVAFALAAATVTAVARAAGARTVEVVELTRRQARPRRRALG